MANFKDLIGKLEPRIINCGAGIRYANLDLGQLEDPSGNPPISWPAALIDFNDTNYSDLLNGIQEANLIVAVRLAFNPYSATSSLQPSVVRNKGLEYFDKEDLVVKAIHGWDADGLCSPFSRIRAVTEKREEDRFRVRLLLFSTYFEDDTCKKGSTRIKPPAALNLGFKP